MPKSPIRSRTVFFSPMRGVVDASTGEPPLQRLEWNAVDTDLGPCVEPYSPPQLDGISGGQQVVQVDAVDASASSVKIMDSGGFQSQYGTGGPIVPTDYNA
jgi:hypothetical protein